MQNRIRRTLIGLGALGAVAFPLAGVASADTEENGFPSTQNPLQAVDGVLATADTANFGLLDSADTFSPGNRPDGVNGTDTEVPQVDSRFVEGPVGGLLLDGPFE